MKIKKLLVSAIVAMTVVGLNGCKKDDVRPDQNGMEEAKLQKKPGASSINANFTYEISALDEYPVKVNFTNTSTGANGYEWSFGNGKVLKSKEPSISILYDSSITYTVKLTAYKGNQSNTIEKKVTVPFLDKSVRIIYITPSDKETNSNYIRSITEAAPNLQEWYRTELNGSTYRLNNPLITTLKSAHNTAWFNTNNGNSGEDPNFYFFYNVYNEIRELLGPEFDTNKYAFTIYVDAPGGTGAGSLGFCVLPEHDLKGLSGQMTEPVDRWIGGWGHELGHAFGLPHPDGQIDEAIMSIGYLIYPSCVLLPSDKSTLLNSGFFF